MEPELQIILAFLFKRSGKNLLKPSDLYLPLSLELGWYTSQQAQQVIANAQIHNLLRKEGELLTPTFDINSIKIPIGFRPLYIPDQKEQKHVQQTTQNVQEHMITYLAEHTQKTKEDIQTIIEEIANKKTIHPEIACLYHGIEKNIDMSTFFSPIDHTLFSYKK